MSLKNSRNPCLGSTTPMLAAIVQLLPQLFHLYCYQKAPSQNRSHCILLQVYSSVISRDSCTVWNWCCGCCWTGFYQKIKIRIIHDNSLLNLIILSLLGVASCHGLHSNSFCSWAYKTAHLHCRNKLIYSSAISTSLLVGAPYVRPASLLLNLCNYSVMCAWPKYSGPHEHM